MDKVFVNLLPAITWNWTKVNGKEIGELPAFSQGSISIRCDSELIIEDTAAKGSDIDARSNRAIDDALRRGELVTGLGPDMDRLLAANGIKVKKIAVNRDCRIFVDYDMVSDSLAAVEFDVADGVSVNVIEKFTCNEKNVKAGVQTRFILGKGAKAVLSQVQRTDRSTVFLNDTGLLQAEDSSFEMREVYLCGGDTYLGARTALNGDRGSFDFDMGYIVDGDSRLDMNFAAFQNAKDTYAMINANGTLKDRAYKLFRATVDFKTGASGSHGEEREDVLMMSDDVTNLNVPLILCSEEDVEGIHAATLGRPSEEALVYMGSRGLDREAVCELMSVARVAAVAAKIEDEQTVQEIEEYLHPGEDNIDR